MTELSQCACWTTDQLEADSAARFHGEQARPGVYVWGAERVFDEMLFSAMR